MLANRLALAAHYGAQVIDAGQGNVVERIRKATGDEGADVVIEAIGATESFLQALQCVRRGGMVSVVGLFSRPVEFPLQDLVYHGVHLSMGLSSLSRMNELMSLLETKRIDLAPLATHIFPLDEALEAYDLFENHKDQCIKVLIKP